MSIEAAEKQAPVAWAYTNAQGREEIVRTSTAPYEDATPLYTHPPKREWVSLTKQEIDVEALKDDYAAYFALGAIWANKKLREKNGC